MSLRITEEPVATGLAELGRVPIAFTVERVLDVVERDGGLGGLALVERRLAPRETYVKDYDAIGWYGLGAPARTPPEIIKKLSEAMNAAIAIPAVKERFLQLGVEPMPLTATEFDAQVKEEVGLYAKFAKAAGLKPN